MDYQENSPPRHDDIIFNPVFDDKSFKTVGNIIDSFNKGDIKTGAVLLRELEMQDTEDAWTHHIAAINAKIDFEKMGFTGASQLLSVDFNGNVITAGPDFEFEQFRSPDSPNNYSKKQLVPTSFLCFSTGGDKPLYEQAQTVNKLIAKARDSGVFSHNIDQLQGEHIGSDLMSEKFWRFLRRLSRTGHGEPADQDPPMVL